MEEDDDIKEEMYMAILNVEDIKEAYDSAKLKTYYRKASLRWHPDKNPGDDTNDQFKMVGQAYEYFCTEIKKLQRTPASRRDSVLDKKKREAADRKPVDPMVDSATGKTRNIVVDVKIDLSESYCGCRKIIEYERYVVCKLCVGGSYLEKKHCKHCQGKNGEKVPIKRTVDIPPSAFNQKLFLVGESHECTSGAPLGDVVIYVTEDWTTFRLRAKFFDGKNTPYTPCTNISLECYRRGHDIVVDRSISVKQSMGQFRFYFCALNDMLITVRKDTDTVLVPNTEAVAKHCGFWIPERQRYGHLYVRFVVAHDTLTRRQRKQWLSVMIADHCTEDDAARLLQMAGHADSEDDMDTGEGDRITQMIAAMAPTPGVLTVDRAQKIGK